MFSNVLDGMAKALFEEAGDALFLFEPNSDVLLATNATAERLTRLGRGDLLKMPATYWFRFGGKGGKDRLREAASTSGVFHSQEGYWLRTQEDGVWVPVNLTVSRLHVQPRTLALITARDMREQREAVRAEMTERTKAEDMLQKVNSFLDSIVENVPIMLFVKDADKLRFQRFNKAGEDLLGYQRADLIGKNDYDFFPKEEADFFIKKDREVLAGKTLVDIAEEEIQTRTGIKILHTTKIPILDDKGRPQYLLGISEDITARKALEETRRLYAEARENHARDLEAKNQALSESERRYRQLTEATLDAIVVADEHAHILVFNPAAERLFGHAAAAVVGQPLVGLMPAEYHELFRRGWRRFLDTGVGRFVGHAVELQGLRRDGTEFPLELALSAFDQGGAVKFLAAIRDLTERNRLRTSLAQNERLASIGRLSAGVAHEINNPLAYVANNLTVLQRDCKGLIQLLEAYEADRVAAAAPQSVRRVEILAEEIDLPYIRENLDGLLVRTREGLDRVTRIIQSLRAHARITPLHRQEVSLADLFDTSIEIIQTRLRGRKIQVERNYNHPSTIRCVFTDINQVVRNVLVNACQAIEAMPATHAGHIRVSIRPEGDELVAEVADNGCGIAPKNLPRLFDPFFTTKDVREGSGLGLWISHSIVTAHGGRIEVDSQPGQGTCLRIILPLDR